MPASIRTEWAPCPPDPASGIAGAFRTACQTELRALKPGNVHIHAAGHGMTVDQFLTSAEVTAPILASPGLTVGERIFQAIAATRTAVGCNTNLGIVLLAAPLAQAALSDGAGPLRERLRRVLAGLTVADAELAFRAIALASPAGLGRVEGSDVHAPATVTLLDAMREARDRDRIARQYATAYADIFETGVPRLRRAMAEGAGCEEAAERLYLDLLATIPDSHVIRKYGVQAAERLCRRAADLREEARHDRALKLTRTRLGELDRELKYNGINPGTTADIVVGSLFSLWLMPRT
ncbi:MAG TPA: triphosphoribosyl-dephospho-CoA synthase [Azospirillum sp.]|nr:triphosphoribosyl-dephospho-CoA synthase [Azospirillum sp.]